MSDIRPLPAIRYNTAAKSGAASAANDLSARLAPPYDVLSEADKQALLARDPFNFVKIDLPFTPPKSAGPAALYAAARREMDAWLKQGVLTQDQTPALYVYHQRYTWGGREFVRKMFFARLRLEPFGAGSVYPHEQTFGGPKEDRLALTKACEANLSPIFGLYPDERNEVAATLDAATRGTARGGAARNGTPSSTPIAIGTLDGVESKLWAASDPALVAKVQQQMAAKPTFIADGHHRYGTGLLYRDWLVQERGPLAADHPANFVLCVFCAMEDAGLQILPTHRVLPGVALTADALGRDAEIEVTSLSVRTPAAALAALPTYGPQALALFSAQTGDYAVLRPRRADVLDKFSADRSPAFRRLALAFLHVYVLDRVVVPQHCGGAAPEIHYVKVVEDAVKEAQQTGGAVFLMQSNTMAELRDVCQAGDLMPQKSTFFYPKLASGLVVNRLS